MISYLRRLRRTVPFDILDTHFGHPDGIAGGLISRALGVPFTMTLRGNEPAHASSRLVRRSLAWAVQEAVRVFTVSERLRQFAIGLGANPDKVKTIPNGVDTSIFHPGERIANRIQYGLDPHKPLIVSAGALIERKGHHRVIRAVSALNRAACGRVQLAIIGPAGPEGAYEQVIRQTISTLHLEADVRLVGSVSAPEMARWMSAADVLCLASTREGWPNVVNEALACGTPVVAADVGAVPDMLPDARYGLVVPINDEAALGAALDQALRKEWDRSAITAWGQRRSWGHVAQDVLEEMHSAIAGAKGMDRLT
jgi:glycosyltransferase involved in cell wall biosynthesis